MLALEPHWDVPIYIYMWRSLSIGISLYVVISLSKGYPGGVAPQDPKWRFRLATIHTESAGRPTDNNSPKSRLQTKSGCSQRIRLLSADSSCACTFGLRFVNFVNVCACSNAPGADRRAELLNHLREAAPQAAAVQRFFTPGGEVAGLVGVGVWVR